MLIRPSNFSLAIYDHLPIVGIDINAQERTAFMTAKSGVTITARLEDLFAVCTLDLINRTEAIRLRPFTKSICEVWRRHHPAPPIEEAEAA
jgi:hypothetical protein